MDLSFHQRLRIARIVAMLPLRYFSISILLLLELFPWSKYDKGEQIVIEKESLLKFVGAEANPNLARTTRPIDKHFSSFYFEAKIVNSGENCMIAIGLTKKSPNTRSGHLPGWETNPKLGIGYHGDDGGIYHESIHAVERGEQFSTGDVVGCYMRRTRVNDEEITLTQFSKNGKKILSPRIISNADWFPTVGIGSPGAIVDTNFGIDQFIFNIKGMYL